MPTMNAPRDPLAELFRDVVLVLGGVFACRGTDDETIWRVARGLERVYRRARARVATSDGQSDRAIEPHPAIAGLLRLTDPEETTR